jgi:hypothetical protein
MHVLILIDLFLVIYNQVQVDAAVHTAGSAGHFQHGVRRRLGAAATRTVQHGEEEQCHCYASQFPQIVRTPIDEEGVSLHPR